MNKYRNKRHGDKSPCRYVDAALDVSTHQYLYVKDCIDL